MNENLTQILDWLLTKWEIVLAYFGGVSGLIAFLFAFIKIICPLIASIINKKSGVNASLHNISEQNKNLELKLVDFKDEMIESIFNKITTELNKRESKKQVIYNKIIEKKDDIKESINLIHEEVIKNKNPEVIEEILEKPKKENLEFENQNFSLEQTTIDSNEELTKVVIVSD